MMSSGVSLAWPISCRMTVRSRSSSLGVEGRVLQDVGEDVERQRHILLQHLGVIGRAFARGIGVEVAADRLDLLGDGESAAPLGALERHVLEEMRDAVDLRRLVPRPDIDPEAERDRVDRVDPVGGDPQPVRQRGNPHRHCCSRAPCMGADEARDRGRHRWAAPSSARAFRRARPSAGGGGGRMPVARSTASGNLAGCAVASATIGAASGRSSSSARAAATATAVCGSIRIPERRKYRRSSASSACRRPGGRKRSRAPRARPASSAGRLPPRRNRRIASATAAPLRPFNSNSSRSKLLDTWMSMLGLRLGSTAAKSSCRRRRDSARGCRCALVPMTSRSIGSPIARARCPA